MISLASDIFHGTYSEGSYRWKFVYKNNRLNKELKRMYTNNSKRKYCETSMSKYNWFHCLLYTIDINKHFYLKNDILSKYQSLY